MVGRAGKEWEGMGRDEKVGVKRVGGVWFGLSGALE